MEAKEPDGAPRGPSRSRVPAAEIAELRDVRFSAAMRGYDREEVDRYVNRVNRVIAELQITAAPESAIRHALEQVTDETKGLLERAHETADEIPPPVAIAGRRSAAACRAGGAAASGHVRAGG